MLNNMIVNDEWVAIISLLYYVNQDEAPNYIMLTKIKHLHSDDKIMFNANVWSNFC